MFLCKTGIHVNENEIVLFTIDMLTSIIIVCFCVPFRLGKAISKCNYKNDPNYVYHLICNNNNNKNDDNYDDK